MVHAAGVIHPRRVADFERVNHRGTSAVLEAAARAGVRRFVHLSSNSPFGTNPHPGEAFRQHEPYRPYLGYGDSKMRAEQEVRAAHDRGDVPTVVVRPPWFYGPWQPERQTRFFSMVAAGRFPVPGDGSQQRSMVYVDNLVQGVALAERHPAAPGQAFWVADRDAYPLRDVVATVRQALDEEGFRTRDTVVRIPRVLAAMAETADRVSAAPGPLLDAGPRPRRAGPDHPLRHLAVGRGARLRPPGRPAGRHATFGALVRARGLRPRPARRVGRATRSRRRERQDGSGHRGQRLLRVAAGRAPARRRLPRCGCSTWSTPPTAPPTWSSSGETSGTPRRWAGAVAGVDVVFHNVAQVPLARDRSLFESVNVGGTAVLLGACERAGVAKVVHTSSSAVFGVPETNPVTRATEPRPVEPYGRAKLDAELLCRAAVSRGLDVVGRAAAHDPGSRPARHLRHPLRLDRRRCVRAGARVAATTSTSSCTPPTWPTPAAGRPSVPVLRSTTSAPSDSAPCARHWRHCASTRAPAPGCAVFRPGRPRLR